MEICVPFTDFSSLSPVPYLRSLLSGQGPVSQKPRKICGPIKPVLDHLSKNRKLNMPETSCMKGTSLHL